MGDIKDHLRTVVKELILTGHRVGPMLNVLHALSLYTSQENIKLILNYSYFTDKKCRFKGFK
jgi:hypothetical protein